METAIESKPDSKKILEIKQSKRKIEVSIRRVGDAFSHFITKLVAAEKKNYFYTKPENPLEILP